MLNLNQNANTLFTDGIKHLFDVSSKQDGTNFYRLYLTVGAMAEELDRFPNIDKLLVEIGSNPDYQDLIVDFLNQSREQAITAEPFFNIHEARCAIIPEYGRRYEETK